MSLKEARRLHKYAKRVFKINGLQYRVSVHADEPEACKLHNPKAHPMCGHAAVIVGNLPPNGQCGRYVWNKGDVDWIAIMT